MDSQTDILLIDPEYTWVNVGNNYTPGGVVDIALDLSRRGIRVKLLSLIETEEEDYEERFIENIRETRAKLQPAFVWIRTTDIFYARYRKIVDALKMSRSSQNILSGGSLIGQTQKAGMDPRELFDGKLLGTRKDVADLFPRQPAEIDISTIKDMVDTAQYNSREFNATLFSTSGCPVMPRCEYCDMTPSGFHLRDSEYLQEAFSALAELGPSTFVFLDNSFAVRKNLRRLLDMNIPSQPKAAMVNLEHLTEENLRMMRALNIRAVLLGLERVPEQSSKLTHRHLDREKIAEILERVRRHGIDIIASFIVGWPEQTLPEALTDWEYAKDLFDNDLVTSFSIHNMNTLNLSGATKDDLVTKGSLDVPQRKILGRWEEVSHRFNWTTAVQAETIPMLLIGGLDIEDFPNIPYADSNMTVREIAYVIYLYLEANGWKFSTTYNFYHGIRAHEY